MYSGELNVFRNGVGNHLSPVGHGVEFDFFASLHEFTDDHRMLLGDFSGKRQEAPEFLLVVADIHRSSGEHIRRPHKHRISHLVDEGMHIVDCGQFLPFRLVYSEGIHYGRELMPVLCLVDALCTRPENIYTVLVEPERQIVRNLSSYRHDDSVRLLELVDVHDALECELVEIEPVAHVIVSGNRFGVVVDHNSPVAFLPDGVERIDGAPVKLHGTSDAVGT